jgi:hypothetical protein
MGSGADPSLNMPLEPWGRNFLCVFPPFPQVTNMNENKYHFNSGRKGMKRKIKEIRKHPPTHTKRKSKVGTCGSQL